MLAAGGSRPPENAAASRCRRLRGPRQPSGVRVRGCCAHWPVCFELVWVPGAARGRTRGAPGSGAPGAAAQGSGPRGLWGAAQGRCRSWECRARSEVLSSSRFLNSEACPAVFQRNADSFRYCPCVGGRAGDEITELCECSFWLLIQRFSVHSLLRSQAPAEDRLFTAASAGELLCSAADGADFP